MKKEQSLFNLQTLIDNGVVSRVTHYVTYNGIVYGYVPYDVAMIIAGERL